MCRVLCCAMLCYHLPPDLLPTTTALLTLIILYNNTLIPFRLAFGFGHVFDRVDSDNRQLPISTGLGVLLLIDWLSDLWQVIEVALKFRTAFVARDGLLVVARRDIEWHYLSGWFVIDLLAVLPFDFVQLGVQKWMAWMRILKCM